MSINIKDVGIVISINKHGESSIILKILSANHGVCKGFVKAAIANKRNRSIYQIGNLVEFIWRAKSYNNLGNFKVELNKSYLAKIIFNQTKLVAISAILKLIEDNILEKEPHQELFNELLLFLENIDIANKEFIINYIFLELNLLQILGYGLDLTSCAVTGEVYNLYYVSPKTGKAVTKEVGEKYHSRLLRLPHYLASREGKLNINQEDTVLGLNLTEFFLKKILRKDSEFLKIRSRLIKIII